MLLVDILLCTNGLVRLCLQHWERRKRREEEGFREPDDAVREEEDHQHRALHPMCLAEEKDNGLGSCHVLLE
ncbi:hypothetical protein PBY51_015598 [Eleginops maclovinus]|uniref:Uncharacterized protein n=1 Tax=Eleginops maclovinus TaxID=56733 RepID=A0AAN7XPS8_ELEMC|nr:hypothetical protein PBY51_015598 [Eleginops maclovinus]